MVASVRKTAYGISMRNPVFALVCLLLAVLCLCLTGCFAEEKKDMESKESAVRAYYNDKYKTNASVSEAKMCERDTHYLGYIPNGDYYYVMSDGSTVMYLSDTDSFIDDRQYDEIKAAILAELWNPHVEQLLTNTDPQKLTLQGVAFGEHNSDSYEGKGFATYYNGNINEFVQAERPTITLEKAEMWTSNSADQEQLQRFFAWVGDAFTPDPAFDVYSAPRGSVNEYGRPIPDENYCEIQLSSKGLRVKKPHYITLLDGVEITADVYDFQLEDGDISVEVVPASEVQAKIDEIYYAMPYESNENSGASYRERDQVHEERDVLLEGTAFKVHFSDRVKAVVDKYGLPCRIRFNDQIAESGNYLFKYSFYKTGSITSGSVVCSPNNQMDYHSVAEEDYLFLGQVREGKAGEEGERLG